MTRIATALVLAFALVACDAEAPLTPAASDAPAVSLASVSVSDDPFPITANAAVRATGETILLHVDGKTIEMRAEQAYLIGDALTRASFDAMPGDLQGRIAEVLPGRRPGVRCEPPSPGNEGVVHEGGTMTSRCPPPPSPILLGEDLYRDLLGEGAEVMEIPEGLDWNAVPGGYVAQF